MTEELTAVVVQLCELLISCIWRLWFSSSCAKAIWSQQLLSLECFAIYCIGQELWWQNSYVGIMVVVGGQLGPWFHQLLHVVLPLLTDGTPVGLFQSAGLWHMSFMLKASYFLFRCFRLPLLGCTWVVEARPKGIVAKRVKWGRKQQDTSAGIEFVDAGAVRKVHLN